MPNLGSVETERSYHHRHISAPTLFSTQRAHRTSSDRFSVYLRTAAPPSAASAAPDARARRCNIRQTAPPNAAVDLARQNRLGVAHVDDLVEPPSEHVALAFIQWLTRLDYTLQITVWTSESQENRHGKMREKRGSRVDFMQTENREFARKLLLIRCFRDVHGRPTNLGV
jgi:hypothetical protein